MIDFYRLGRWSRTTRTWVKKSCALLLWAEHNATSDDQLAVIGYEAYELLWTILFEVDLLAPLIPDEQIEECERHARDLFHALRDRRRALALANTTGRTPEEAATFESKAAALGAPR